MNSEDLLVIVTQALEAMKEEAGEAFDIEKVNLAELGRRTGLSISPSQARVTAAGAGMSITSRLTMHL